MKTTEEIQIEAQNAAMMGVIAAADAFNQLRTAELRNDERDRLFSVSFTALCSAVSTYMAVIQGMPSEGNPDRTQLTISR